MMNVIGSIIKEYLERDENLMERELKINEVEGKAITIVGVRRAGKTSFLLHHFRKLRDEGKNVIFFPFDDDRIYPPSLETIGTVIKVAKEIYPEGKIHFFFDEIQEVEGWERAVKRIVEREKHRVFLTGSSSRLLSREIATQLRGRTISYEIFPFSFREIIRLNNLKVSKYYTEDEEAKIKSLLRKHLEWGGFPELWTKNYFEDKILREYMDVMLYRDLIERYGIRNHRAIKLFLKATISSFSKRISIRKLSSYMESEGIKVSRNTLHNYLEYSRDSYIIFPVRKYSRSLREVEQSKPKIYPIDSGIVRVFAHRTSEDFGRLMEWAVFMELRRKYIENKNIFYYVTSSGKEIDFLLNFENEKRIIEVTYEYDEMHIKKIFRAMEELKIKEGLLLTWDTSDIVERGEKKIKIIPLWRWLLENR